MDILENKNNILIFDDGRYLCLVSYNSKIARYDKKTCYLNLNKNKWDYSQTTLKHLKHFINDYVEQGYYTTKKDFEAKIKKNGFIFLTDDETTL